MFFSLAKRTASRLPLHWQQRFKRMHYRRQIRNSAFRSLEFEWDEARHWLQPGDWVIDVGANVGHYTKRFSDLVGPSGRVIAFEPVPDTFEMLTCNTALFEHANVCLLNLAASSSTDVVSMTVPNWNWGLKNYYLASLSKEETNLKVMTCAIDSLELPGKVRLIKIDAEGHDDAVVNGASRLIAAQKPMVLIESASKEVDSWLRTLGYQLDSIAGSHNAVYRHPSLPL